MKKKRISIIMFGLYMTVLLRITVFRSSFSLYSLFQKGTLNLTLFADYLPLLYQGRWLRFLYLFVGNIVWFIPFGAFWYGIGIRRDMRRILLLGFLFSLTIETLQFVFGTGVSELDDLILNTFGVWVGAKSCQICLKIFGLSQEKGR
ncbi:VanZ family protein [Clostridiaceae bacterium]|nr:VanZ family protein [Clostridiaceae bacterium]